MFRVRDTGEIQSEVEVRRRFPNTSIPKVMNSQVCDSLGVDPIISSTPPNPGRYFYVTKDGVVQDEQGSWVWNWVVEEMTDEQKAEVDAEQASKIRHTRDMRLMESDWTQGKDISSAISEEWATYRQELRDVSEQEGFPWNVIWPVKPTE